MENNIIDTISKRNYIKRYLLLTIGLLISAINYNLLVLPLEIVCGGTSGIATILNYLLNLEPSLIIFFQSFILLILCFCFLGIDDTTAMAYITIVYPLFIRATSGINEIFIINHEDILLLSIFIGILTGISNGIIFKTGLNNGGYGVLSKIISNKKKASITKSNMIINSIIVLAGGAVFGINKVLYAIIILIIQKNVSDKIVLGISKNKTIIIVSSKYEEICNYLNHELKHDVTIFNTKGKYTNSKQKTIMSVIPTKEYIIIKEIIKDIDKNAFVIVCDSYETRNQDKLLKKGKMANIM